MTTEQLLELFVYKRAGADEHDVAIFERKIGARLPDEYRSFLFQCNGGCLAEGVMFEYVKPCFTIELCWFGGVQMGWHHSPSESLWEAIESYQDVTMRMPKEVIWIADDHFGNAVCLGVHGGVRGMVFIWLHEGECDVSDPLNTEKMPRHMALAGNSFVEFIGRLKMPAGSGNGS